MTHIVGGYLLVGVLVAISNIYQGRHKREWEVRLNAGNIILIILIWPLVLLTELRNPR